MKQIHLNIVDSTQRYILEECPEAKASNVLISCDEQTQGRGQYSRKWDSYNETLCFSLSLAPANTLTLSSIEMGVLVCKYFYDNFGVHLFTKWPNDIYNKNKEKVGGIILNRVGKDNIFVGIGINFFLPDNVKNYDTGLGHVFNQKHDLNKQETAFALASYIEKNRLTDSQIISYWEDICIHMDTKVQIIDEQQSYSGTFSGIGKMGSAILDIDGTNKEFFSGSLRIL